MSTENRVKLELDQYMRIGIKDVISMLKGLRSEAVIKIVQASEESEIAEPPHRNLDSESLSFLFEILLEQPLASAKKLCGTASEAGLTIPERAVSSYRKRLKILGII